MKLYTEEQVKAMIEKSQYTGLTADFLIHMSPSVQLPSDEEIKESMSHYDESDTDDEAFLAGAIWMRNKIQGGNK